MPRQTTRSCTPDTPADRTSTTSSATSTDADSSATELAAHDTTCQNKLDTAAYWAPALLREGVPVTPSGSVAHYQPGPGMDLASLHPYPPGLMMIAGDPAATEPQAPDGHPVAIRQFIFEVHYPLTGDPTGLELASGGVHGVHADFLNAWHQAALEREVRVCLNRGKVCGVVSNRATG